MNIFFLSLKPRECAQFHCDKHVVKMIVEYCQLLSTAQRPDDTRDKATRIAEGAARKAKLAEQRALTNPTS